MLFTNAGEGVRLPPRCNPCSGFPKNLHIHLSLSLMKALSMTQSSPLSIDLKDVTKTYRGGVFALRGVSLQVHPGEIFGLLGPNGAGKSTLVKIMMTVVRPTTARGQVLGQPVGHNGTLANVGYLPEHHRFPPWLTGRQAIEFAGAMCKMPRKLRRHRTDELLELVHMREWAKKRLGTYSKGMQQRIGLAASLVNDPQLVLLDEPTDGVDPVGRREIRDVLTHMREQGKSVLVNSHILSELEMICDRVAILVQGLVARQGTVASLTSSSRCYEVISRATPEQASSLDGVEFESLGEGRSLLRIPSDDPVAIQPILDQLRSSEVMIESVLPKRESLEDLFVRSVTDPSTGVALDPGANRNTEADVRSFETPSSESPDGGES